MHLNKLIISFFFNLKKEFLINVIFILTNRFNWYVLYS